MKFVSHAALAAVLAIGTLSVVSVPAEAQRKKEEKKAEIKVSKEFRDPMVAADTALKAGDVATAEAQLATAAAAAKSDDEKYFASALRLQIAAQKKDNPGIASAIDELLVNPKTPQTDLGRYNFARGELTLAGKQPAQALPFFLKARELGYQNADLDLLIASAKLDSGDVNGGVADLEKAIAGREAAGQKAPETWYRLAASKLQQANNEAALAEWLRRLVRNYPTAQNWRTAINIYRTSGSRGIDDLDRDGRIELYRLMRATNALADQNDYARYADAANNAGLRHETVSVIEEGRATGKIPSSAAAVNGLYTAAKAAIAREGSLASLETEAKGARDGKLALLAANSYLGTKNFAKAIELYRVALQKGGVNPVTTNMNLGAALAQAGQGAEAKQVLATVTDPSRKELAAFWGLYVDAKPQAAATASASPAAGQ